MPNHGQNHGHRATFGSRRPFRPARQLRSALAAAILLALPLTISPSSAEPTPEELVAARQLFNEGKVLETEKAWAEALEKFKKVAGVKMTPQVRFHIALCEENLGRLVSAINGFELAAEEANRAGASAADVADKAPLRAEALRKRVATLRIEVTRAPQGAQILLDGAPLSAAVLGVDVPMDPGPHVVEVLSVSGKSVFRKELVLEEQTPESLNIEILEQTPMPLAPRPSRPRPPPPHPGRPYTPILIAGGVGVASLVTSGVFFGLRASTIATIAATCQDKERYLGCDPKLEATRDAGRTYTTLSSVMFGVGLAGLATAGVLFWTLTPKKAPTRAAVRVLPYEMGIQVQGAY